MDTFLRREVCRSRKGMSSQLSLNRRAQRICVIRERRRPSNEPTRPKKIFDLLIDRERSNSFSLSLVSSIRLSIDFIRWEKTSNLCLSMSIKWRTRIELSPSIDRWQEQRITEKKQHIAHQSSRKSVQAALPSLHWLVRQRGVKRTLKRRKDKDEIAMTSCRSVQKDVFERHSTIDWWTVNVVQRWSTWDISSHQTVRTMKTVKLVRFYSIVEVNTSHGFLFVCSSWMKPIGVWLILIAWTFDVSLPVNRRDRERRCYTLVLVWFIGNVSNSERSIITCYSHCYWATRTFTMHEWLFNPHHQSRWDAKRDRWPFGMYRTVNKIIDRKPRICLLCDRHFLVTIFEQNESKDQSLQRHVNELVLPRKQ